MAGARPDDGANPDDGAYPDEDLWDYGDWTEVTASRREGIPRCDEDKLRQLGLDLIWSLRAHFRTSDKVLHVAVTYFHKYFCLKSFRNEDTLGIAAACFFLAEGKIDKRSVIPADASDASRIIAPMHVCDATRAIIGRDNFDRTFGPNPQLQLIEYEGKVIGALAGKHPAKHPFEFLEQILPAITGSDEHRSRILYDAENIYNDSLRTLACVRWRPDVLAVVMIHMAAEQNGLKVTPEGIVPANDNSTPRCWWSRFVEGVAASDFDDIARNLATLCRTYKEALQVANQERQAAANAAYYTGMPNFRDNAASRATFDAPAFDRMVPPFPTQSSIASQYSTRAVLSSAGQRSLTTVPPPAIQTYYDTSRPPPPISSTTVPAQASWTNYHDQALPQNVARNYSVNAPNYGSITNFNPNVPPPNFGSETSRGLRYNATADPHSAQVHRSPNVLPPGVPAHTYAAPSVGLQDLSVPPPSRFLSSQQLATIYRPQLSQTRQPPPPSAPLQMRQPPPPSAPLQMRQPPPPSAPLQMRQPPLPPAPPQMRQPPLPSASPPPLPPLPRSPPRP